MKTGYINTNYQVLFHWIKVVHVHYARVEVLRKNNVRLAVNSGEKKIFHRKAPASFSVECAESGEFL